MIRRLAGLVGICLAGVLVTVSLGDAGSVGSRVAAAGLPHALWVVSGPVETPPALFPPNAPSGLKKTYSSKTRTITLRWNDNSNDEDYFQVQRAKRPKSGKLKYGTVARLPAGTKSLSLKLSKGVYYFRVRACNNAGCSAYTTSVRQTVK